MQVSEIRAPLEVAPVPRSPVQDYLERVHDELRRLDDGEVATYIPALAKADPSWFGISVVTADGVAYDVGEVAQQFTIQSISKPFLYGMALEAHGVDEVLGRVGVEPTGDPFNSVTVDEQTNRPFNPMVNAGAIVTTGLVVEAGDDPLAHILAKFAAIVGHQVTVDERVFRSERATGDRNRAIAFLMRNFDVLDGDVEAVLDLYFRQCSLLVSCRDLAVGAATLANRGVNPMTGVQALDERYVENVLSVMQMCGMYDYAGSWTYSVGLPAKSGVAGGVMAVLPGQLGIGVFSPRLEAHGNSVRGIEVCRRLAHDLALHPFRVHPAARGVVRGRFRGDRIRSTRVRSGSDARVLDAQAPRTVVHELQGELNFGTTEALVRSVLEDLDGVDLVVLEGRRLGRVDEPAAELLAALARSLGATGRGLVVAEFPSEVAFPDSCVSFDDVDEALEWCEDRILGERGAAATPATPLGDQELLRDLDAREVRAVEDAVSLQELPAGTVMIREGAPADDVYFLLAGKVSVRLHDDGDGTSQRLAAFGPGVAVGDAALLDGARRSADVVVDEPTVAAVLSLEDFARLRREFPELAAKLYANLARVLSERLHRTNTHLRALRQ